MNFGKIITSIVVVALLAAGIFWVFSGGDETNTSKAPTVTDQVATQSQSAATPADQLPGQTVNPGVGSTESKPLSRAEVSNHNVLNDCWTIIEDTVYDLSTFVPDHPGGEEEISQACGKDATALFTGQSSEGREHSPDARNILAEYELGPLES